MKKFYFVLFCFLKVALYSQCPDDAGVLSNNKCLEVSWDTPPMNLATISLVFNSNTYTFISGLGTTSSPAIYRSGPNCTGGSLVLLSGSLTSGTDNCTYLNGVLPVKLSFFDGVIKEGNVLLNWQSLTETNNDRYNIAWSDNSIDWRHVHSVKGEGSSNIKNDYSVELPLEKGVNYFKLDQVDFDGTTTELGIQTFEYNGNNRFNIYPNPAANGITIDYNSKEEAEATITDILGRVVKKIMISSGEKIDITGLPIGNYNIHFKTSEGLDFNKVLSKI